MRIRIRFISQSRMVVVKVARLETEWDPVERHLDPASNGLVRDYL